MTQRRCRAVSGWLRAHNKTIVARDRVGFYGLDLYSLHASIEAVPSYLDQVDLAASARAALIGS
ncbi:MAG: erythromycin esterase family protein [Ilumatobacteraceae bacterium]|nr:erythromycin esterase family protein [Ilumatobacteraceae bacterium]